MDIMGIWDISSIFQWIYHPQLTTFFNECFFNIISAWIRHEEKRPSHGEMSRGFHPIFFKKMGI